MTAISPQIQFPARNMWIIFLIPTSLIGVTLFPKRAKSLLSSITNTEIRPNTTIGRQREVKLVDFAKKIFRAFTSLMLNT